MTDDLPTRRSDAPPDLEAIKEKWLQLCGPCDGGLPMACSHPDEDYRPVILELVNEIQRLRADAELGNVWDLDPASETQPT